MELADQVAVGTAAAMFVSAVFVALQALFTRKLVSATTAAYLEGHVLLSVVPYGGTGAINLRLENVGAGYVQEVSLSFPCGLMAIGNGNLVDLADSGVIPGQIGSLGPHEKREWSLGFTGHPRWSELPKRVQYEVAYCKGVLPRKWYRWREKKLYVNHHGVLHLNTYTGSLVKAYTGLEDLRVELQALHTELKSIKERMPDA